MVTNYSQYDKVKGKEVWAVPICLALAAGILWGIVKYGNNCQHNLYKNQGQEIRVVQSQEYDSKGLEKLAIREK